MYDKLTLKSKLNIDEHQNLPLDITLWFVPGEHKALPDFSKMSK